MEKVIIIDAQKRYGAGLSQLLMENGQEVIEVLEGTLGLTDELVDDCDVIILDYIEEFVSEEILTELYKKYPNKKWLLITALNQAKETIDECPINFNAYLSKECPDEEILEAIESVVSGKRFYCQQLLSVITDDKNSDGSCESVSLTKRELEILEKISEGLTEKMIGDQLNISHHTVHSHRKNIMKKFNVGSTSELLTQALKTKLL